MYTEDKVKIVAASWGTEFLAAPAICTRPTWSIGWFAPYSSPRTVEISLSFKIVLVQCAKQLAPQGFEAILSPKKQRRPLPSLLYKSCFSAYLRKRFYKTWFSACSPCPRFASTRMWTRWASRGPTARSQRGTPPPPPTAYARCAHCTL